MGGSRLAARKGLQYSGEYRDDDGEWHQRPAARAARGSLFQWSNETSSSGAADLDEPLVTDRPDFTEASTTVGKGVAQIEFGYTLTYNADDDTSERSNSWGEPLLRYGILADWLELRVGLFPVEERTTTAAGSDTPAGTEDMYLGLKVALTPQQGILPAMALIPQMTVPTGSPALTDDRVLPGLNWVYSWEISEFLAVAGSTQGNRVIDEVSSEPHLVIAQSATAAYTLTDELGAYTEFYAFFPQHADSARSEYYFNGGFTYLLSNDVQFDIRAGWGLNSAADDYLVGTGLSIRF